MFMVILVINSGSSSLKYKLIDMKNEATIVKGIIEKIGTDKATLMHSNLSGVKLEKFLGIINTHKEALFYVIKMLSEPQYGAIKGIDEVFAVGHRVVHGGRYFDSAAIIDDTAIRKLKRLESLAPLHNKANLAGILACRELFGTKVPQVAVFDTSFYCDIPPKAYMFAVPYEYYEKYHVRKYGFHGTSHRYVSERCAELIGRPINQLKIITCHLGNGSSITAIDKGKAVDTSMGLTPLGGIMMGTRCGSLDPSVVTFIAEKENLSISQLDTILNKSSGLLGISGISNDDRAIMDAIHKGNERALLSHEMLDYQIIKYIGAYIAAMNGCDAIVFTAGIGENQWCHRKAVCDNLSFLGVKINDSLNKNAVLGGQGKISENDSLISVFVIGTDEEIIIARDTLRCIKKLNKVL